MQRLRRIFSGIAIILLAVTPILAQQTVQLNRVLKPTELPDKVKAKAAGNERIYFELNKKILDKDVLKAGDFIQVSVTEDEIRSLKIKRVTSYRPGTTSVIAEDPEHTGDLFSFTLSGNGIIGLFHTGQHTALHFKFDQNNELNFITAKKEKQLFCELDKMDLNQQFKLKPDVSKGKSQSNVHASHSPNVAAMAASVEDSITVDLMIVYTDAAEEWAELSFSVIDINQTIAQAMNLSQAAIDNSGLAIELRLVHVYKTDYDEENDGGSTTSGDRLRRLTSAPTSTIDWEENSGFMDAVHVRRDLYGADIVSMLASINDTGGIGWLMSSTNGDPELGFNLCRVQQVADNYTMIHEIGHNMGNAHARNQNASPADDDGGLFHYSAGYRNEFNNISTVMGYSEGLEDIPLFSSPNLRWEGVVAGSNNAQRPTDNARSMKEIKRVISGYRQTQELPPSASISSTMIEVEMNREDEFDVFLDVSNDGASPLVWDIDFDFPESGSLNKKSKTFNGKEVSLTPAQAPEVTTAAFNVPFKKETYKEAPALVYNTSFEGTEGFSEGTFEAILSWRALSNNAELVISSDHPQSGSRHLRVEHQPDVSNTQFIESPFFGQQPFGSYEISLDFAISNTPNSLSERFDIYFFDSDTQDLSAGVIMSQGEILVWGENEALEGTFIETSGNVNPGTYHNLKIGFNTNEGLIQYYLNDQLISENKFVGESRSPDFIYVVHANEQAGTFIDIDNVELTKNNTPYDWLFTESYGGVTFEEETSQVKLTFNTKGISAGVYQTDLMVYTNDPENPVTLIPITLSVNDAVPNEKEPALPEKISLDQNYPNPFNPVTTINYTLGQSEKVTIDVYNIQGKKVTTLINRQQSAGSHEVIFDASNLSSGVYMYRLTTPSQTLSRQMVLIK